MNRCFFPLALCLSNPFLHLKFGVLVKNICFAKTLSESPSGTGPERPYFPQKATGVEWRMTRGQQRSGALELECVGSTRLWSHPLARYCFSLSTYPPRVWELKNREIAIIPKQYITSSVLRVLAGGEQRAESQKRYCALWDNALPEKSVIFHPLVLCRMGVTLQAEYLPQLEIK